MLGPRYGLNASGSEMLECRHDSLPILAEEAEFDAPCRLLASASGEREKKERNSSSDLVSGPHGNSEPSPPGRRGAIGHPPPRSGAGVMNVKIKFRESFRPSPRLFLCEQRQVTWLTFGSAKAPKCCWLPTRYCPEQRFGFLSEREADDT